MAADDKLSPISDENPARDIIRRCRDEEYGSAQAIAGDLEELMARLDAV